MSIIFHEKSREFHLFNEEVSYVIEIMDNGHLGNLYYGRKLHDAESFEYLHDETYYDAMAAYTDEVPSRHCLQHLRVEYPSYGSGDYRYPAVEILQENGSKLTNFQYQSHEIFKGKRPLEGLPATYVEDDAEADTLEITLRDELIGTEVVLSYTIYEELSVITRSSRFKHEGEEPVKLEVAMSASVDLPGAEFEMIQLSGSWARERYVKCRKIEQGTQGIYSMRGASSAEHNPFLALKRENTTESAGEVYGFSLVYSGNFLGQVEVGPNETTRITMGLHPNLFEWELAAGDSFQTPEVVMVYSAQGLNHMSQAYHKLYRTRLARGYWRDKVRPILLNNWEATLMDFDEASILEIAKKGAEVGVELFVLDDGWFGERNSDKAGLGDWDVNLKKLPSGIDGLAKKIEDMGMKFGLWIEPEMINKDSKLYQEHPDWLLATPGRFESPSRFQHVLDFSRKEVVDYIHEKISKVIRESDISYIKWDMNRYITECYSQAAPAAEQGKVFHQYILGVYDLYTRLTEEFPKVLFESCASGGARFDPAMLYFAPQGWTSDDTDANERTKIQYGTSFVYPVSCMGAHVSESPNQQLFRNIPLETRANVAYFGTFGYEMDLNELSEEEIALVKKQIVFMKEHRELIQKGVFYRLKSPFEGNNDTSWMVVDESKTTALAAYYQSYNKVNLPCIRIKLDGLDENALYEMKMEDTVEQHYGSELMYAGVLISRHLLNEKGGDYTSVLIELKRVAE